MAQRPVYLPGQVAIRTLYGGLMMEVGDCCRMCGTRELDALGCVASFPFVECRNCRFTFTPLLTRETAANLYASGYHGPEDGSPPIGWADSSFLVPALERLAGRVPLRILDFGTGTSVVPDQLRGWGHTVTAVDVIPPVVPHPDRLTGCLLELNLAPGQFDLVFSFQTFEHLPEPRPFLEELLRLTRPGGLLLIHTDMEMPERDAGSFSSWWYVLPPDHCSFFRHQTFSAFLAGRRDTIVRSDPKSVLIEAAP